MPFSADISNVWICKGVSEPIGVVTVLENTEAPNVWINVLRTPDEPF